MAVIIGPVLLREGGYAFDAWTPERGLSRSYVYHPHRGRLLRAQGGNPCPGQRICQPHLGLQYR